MEDNFLNLHNDLNALSEEEFLDNSYIAFNDLHGCITNEYNIVHLIQLYVLFSR